MGYDFCCFCATDMNGGGGIPLQGLANESSSSHKGLMMSKRQTILLAAAIACAALLSKGTGPAHAEDEVTPTELFDQRILPIFRSPQPSSCVQCHLASVDLKNYILPSAEKTFVSLRDQGLIDLDAPEKSKILTLIRMGERDLDAGARLIHQQTRRAEYDAFAAWIAACSRDPAIRSLPGLDPSERARPARSDAVIRHTRKSRVVDSFVRNIWSQRLRCFPCHTPFDIDASNPRHQAAIKSVKKFTETYGEQLVQRIEFFRKTPAETLQYLIDKSRDTPAGEIPLLNLEDPPQSLLVMKPTSKLPPKKADGTFEIPPNAEPMFHLGGLKMHRDDQSYKSFIAWIQDYANVVGERYTSVEDLPADNWYGSKLMLKIVGVPETWPVGTPVQMFVHAFNAENQSWASEPVAFTQGIVNPRKIVAGSLFLLLPENATSTPRADSQPRSLPRGKYLVKTYVDSQHRLATDPTRLLGDEDFAGQAELEKARWRVGPRRAESIPGEALQKK